MGSSKKTTGPTPQTLERRVTALKKKLPVIIANTAENFFKDNFRLQGYQGSNGLSKWKPRKKETPQTVGKGILIGTGNLKNGIEVTAHDLTITATVTGPAKKYADAHNKGFRGTVTVKAHTRRRFEKHWVRSTSLLTGKTTGRTKSLVTKSWEVRSFKRKMFIPKRQFIGNSRVLTRKIQSIIKGELRQLAK